jgi:uncharacterized protein YjbJ (UPF0337 family)
MIVILYRSFFSRKDAAVILTNFFNYNLRSLAEAKREKMSDEEKEGKMRKEFGKAEEKIGKDFEDPNMKIQGKADKEFGQAEEKVGKERKKEGV